MKSRLATLGAIVTIVLGVGAVADAAINPALLPCQEAIAKSGGKFVGKKMKAIQKCNDKNLKTPGSCAPGDLATTIAALVVKLSDGIDKKCSEFGQTAAPAGLGFPGKCDDPTPGDVFTLSDLKSCIHTSHEDIVDGLIDLEYGTTTGPITDTDLLKCQKAISKDGGKVLAATLKAVQKCRNAINKGTLTGILPKDCATDDVKTAASITKAVSKAQADIGVKKCTDAHILALDVCNPNATTAVGAAACITSTHQLAADDPAPTSADLIDFEYATPPLCGDGVVNTPSEECDGSDLSGCTSQGFSGPCGSAVGNFACLCLDIPRERVVEHASADLDNGWTGASHDSGVVEGGGYVADLYDCDNVTDFSCNVGPSCSGGAHAACSNDGQCASLGQGTCRKRITAVGPHCALNIQTSCPIVNGNVSCSAPNDFCKTTFHGPPLPLSSGGISVCVTNVFTEDVVGTKNLTTGSAAVRIRQGSITRLGPSTSQPCPVCGGFCDKPAGGDRRNCTTNADCASIPPAGTIACKTDFVCSHGPNVDKECRPAPPFGGGTTLFGTTSVDCPSDASLISPAVGLDILFNPATTGTVSVTPTVQCDDLAFNNKRCMGGSSDGRLCTTASECPGGACSFQCYCPNGGGQKQRPNSCDAACVIPGGAFPDAQPCSVDGDCPGGFCHPADCRPDPVAPVAEQPNEGACSVTVEGHCSVSGYLTCSVDADCQPPGCPNCQPTETCLVAGKNCFLNSNITRTGQADPTNPLSVATFCIAQTSTPSVNTTAGLPGPGALFQPSTTINTGF